MSGYEMGLTENMYLSLALIVGSLVFGSYSLYQGILKHKVLWIVFGGIAIGLGFLQWMIGMQMAVLGICFGAVACALSHKEGKGA